MQFKARFSFSTKQMFMLSNFNKGNYSINKSFGKWKNSLTDMTVYGIVLVFYSRFILVNNMILPKDYQADKSMPEDLATSPEEVDTFNQTKNSAESYKDSSHVYGFMEKETHQNNEDAHSTETQKPCSVVVLSNVQNPSVQSLLRKYRYDANGTLIPSSVKYFIKVPKSRGHQAVLVPINDKAFSPLGGFVRYYKEVPPIPQTWK